MADFLVHPEIVDNKVGELLQSLGVNLEDSNFKETPRRLAAVLREFFKSEYWLSERLVTYRRAVFPSKNDELVVLGNISPVYTFCQHHILPVVMRVAVGYLPGGCVIGLSKLPRVAKDLAKVPMLQEDYTVRLKELLRDLLETENVGVVVDI